MHLDEEAIGPGGHGGLGHGPHQLPFARAVAGVNDDGQVGQPLEDGHGVDVQSVAGVLLEGADAPLAKHHPPVVMDKNVFRREEELLQGGHHPPFEQDGLARFAYGVQQAVVLHIASSDLEDVGVLSHQGHLLRSHHLGDDSQAGLLPYLGQYLQSLLPQALEAVGRGAGLEGPAAQDFDPGLLDRPGHLPHLLPALHGAGAGHDHHLPPPDPLAVQRDDGILRLEITAGQLEGVQDAHHPLHAGEKLEAFGAQGALVADDADDRPFFASREVGSEAQGLDVGHHLLDLLLLGPHFHHDNHGNPSSNASAAKA